MKKFLLILVLVSGMWLRLWLAPKAFHDDIYSNAGWGTWIYQHGPKGFYENNVWVYSWPTQPPLISYIYGWNKSFYVELLGRIAWINHQVQKIYYVSWLDNFVQWFAFGIVNIEIPFQIGYLITMKLLPIFADVGIALLMYKLSNRLFWPTVYLFFPFSWYLSALWGQYDQVSSLILFLAFLAVTKKKIVWLSPILAAISILLKPTGLVLMPLLAGMYIWKCKYWKQLIFGGLLGLCVFTKSTSLFADRGEFAYWHHTLIRMVFFKSEFRVSTNAFNAWRILIGNKAVNQDAKFLSLPAKWWGYGVMAISLIIVFKKYRKWTDREITESVFLISGSAWMFMTGMLDRYVFMAIFTGLVACMYNQKLLSYWVVLALIFSINLYHGWWFPNGFVLKQILEWNNGVITQGLSLVNVLVYIKMAKLIVA